jgi:hypothetical protein
MPTLPAIEEEQREEKEDQYWCTIVSIVPLPIREFKPGLTPARFILPPSSDGDKDIQILHVTNANHFVYLDEDRGSLRVNNLPDNVARSVVLDYINSQLGISETSVPGLFFVPGKLTVQQIKDQFGKKLDRYRGLQKNWLLSIVRIADNDWAKFHQHTVISDFQRKAALILNLNPEQHTWMSLDANVQMVKCPACKTVLDPDASICAACKCVIKKDTKFEFAGETKK